MMLKLEVGRAYKLACYYGQTHCNRKMVYVRRESLSKINEGIWDTFYTIAHGTRVPCEKRIHNGDIQRIMLRSENIRDITLDNTIVYTRTPIIDIVESGECSEFLEDWLREVKRIEEQFGKGRLVFV